jgi:hypothetical protein
MEKYSDFDEEMCEECEHYQICYNVFKGKNIFGENLPKVIDLSKKPITQEEVNEFKKELNDVIYFSEFERKLNAGNSK